MRGQIIKIIRNIHVVNCDNENYECTCRGKIRNQKITPLVGDYVKFDKEKCVIEEVLERRNFFNRPMVANIDQAILITSLKTPDFSLELLDKLISWMEIHNTDVIICLTKEDLLNKEELDLVYEKMNYYKNLGYQVVSNRDIDTIKSLLEGKTTVFTGQTGSGKSTLLNKLNPEWDLKTGEVSLALGRGRHTTRVVELFTYGCGKVLDTPGFSALDFTQFDKLDIRDSFIEFKDYPCPFRDCMHINEKECSVIRKVEEGNILESRYNHYKKIVNQDRR